MIPKPVLVALRLLLGGLSRIAPSLAAGLAFRLFSTPIGARKVRISGRRLERALSVLGDGVRRDLDGIAVWEWAPDLGPAESAEPVESAESASAETVILVHGWTSRALYMTSFVAPLRAAGYRVVAFDFPGHGESRGSRLTFDRAGSMIVDLAERFGPVASIVGHSFGASMAVLAASGHPVLGRSASTRSLALVSGANALKDVSQRFADSIGLSDRGKRGIDERLEAIGGAGIDEFTTVRGIEDAGVPVLLIHDVEDLVVPFSDAETIRRETGAQLAQSERLGHNRILYAPQTFAALTDFLASCKTVEPV